MAPRHQHLGFAHREEGELLLSHFLGHPLEQTRVRYRGVVPKEEILCALLLEEEVGHLGVEALGVLSDREMLYLEERHILLGVRVVELQCWFCFF